VKFPRLPRLKPPKPPPLAGIVNAPLEVAAKAISRFETDMNQIATDLESIGQPLKTPRKEAPPVEAQPEVEAPVEAPAASQPVAGTACLQCTDDHLSTLVGALNEAMRFARESGVDQAEVQRRLHIATDELNICERIDLAPDKTANLGPAEKKVAGWILPKLRKIRHQLKEVTDADSLEQVAAMAATTREEYSTRYKSAKGE